MAETIPTGFWRYHCHYQLWNKQYAATLPPPLLHERALLQRPGVERAGIGHLLPCERLRRFVLEVVTDDDIIIADAIRYELDHRPREKLVYWATRFLGSLETAIDEVASMGSDQTAQLFHRLNDWVLNGRLFAGIPFPWEQQQQQQQPGVLGMAIFLRLLVAAACREWIRLPRVREEDVVAGQHGYVADLFIDTHLDWLAAAVKCQRLDDAYWLETKEGRTTLTATYPLPNRVACAEELLDMGSLFPLAIGQASSATNESSKAKQHKTLESLIAHCFGTKQENAICHVRQFPPSRPGLLFWQ